MNLAEKMSPSQNQNSKLIISYIKIKIYPSKTIDSNINQLGQKNSTEEKYINQKHNYKWKHAISKKPHYSTTTNSKNSKNRDNNTSNNSTSNSKGKSKIQKKKIEHQNSIKKYLSSYPGTHDGKQETQRHPHQ